jgi:hypothetical protein
MKILLDGSNVLFWRGVQADAALPALVARALIARRFSPHVIFDHSVWRHMGAPEIEGLRAFVEVTTAPRGTPADAMLLARSKQGQCQIVSRDQFRAWRAQHPALRRDWVVTGQIGKGGRVSFSKKLRPAPL